MVVSFRASNRRGQELMDIPSNEVRRLPDTAEIIFWTAVISSSPPEPCAWWLAVITAMLRATAFSCTQNVSWF
jgi:hypothetical protein